MNASGGGPRRGREGRKNGKWIRACKAKEYGEKED